MIKPTPPFCGYKAGEMVIVISEPKESRSRYKREDRLVSKADPDQSAPINVTEKEDK